MSRRPWLATFLGLGLGLGLALGGTMTLPQATGAQTPSDQAPSDRAGSEHAGSEEAPGEQALDGHALGDEGPAHEGQGRQDSAAAEPAQPGAQPEGAAEDRQDAPPPAVTPPSSAEARQAREESPLPPLPATLPPGYVMEAKGRVRWIYPNSASDDVSALQGILSDRWRALEKQLGQPLGDELDVRVAVDPSDMRRLVSGRALPSYASGVAFPNQGLILLSMTAPESWQRPDMEALLTHELAHVALHRAVGGTPVPRWFTEGVAIHAAGERSLARIRTLWAGTLSQSLMPVEQLSQAFPRNHHEVDLAYAQSADLVRYMLDGDDDRRRFRDLVGFMRDGQHFTEAVQAAYHVSLGYIEREWRNEITRRYGRWPTVLAGLTGLWALGALLLMVGYIRTRRRHHQTLQRWAAEEAAADGRATPRLITIEAPGGAQTNRNAEGARPHRVDEVFDRIEEGRREHSGVPTVEHEGRSYTLH